MKKKSILLITFFLFITVLSVMFFHHENWRDEAQAYLLCRDMNLYELFKNIPYEGHPILYYLFLYPIVKLGIGPKSVNILSFIFMTISVYLILFKSKLNNIQKLCIIISYPVLYEFSIIGRSYSLLFLLLTIYGLLYPNREKHPIFLAVILGLILNTHLFMAGFVGINFFLFYIYKILKNKKKTKKEILIGFLIMLLFFCLLFIQFYPYLFINEKMTISHTISFAKFIMLFFSILFGGCGLQSIIITTLSIIVFIFIYIYFYKKEKSIFTILIISYLFIIIFIAFTYNNIAIYTLVLSLSLLFTIVIATSKKIKYDINITIALVIISIFSSISTVKAYYLDYNYNYSSSKEIAQYINNNIEPNSIFICNTDSLCSSIIPYVDNKFYNSRTNKSFTYIIWNKEREQKTNKNKLFNYIDNNNSIYYIVSYYDYKADIDLLKQLRSKYNPIQKYISRKTISNNDESYIIYQIK